MRIEMAHSGQCCVTELRPVDWFGRPHDRMTLSTSFQANIRLRINKNPCIEPGYLLSKDSARFRDQTGQLPSLKPVPCSLVEHLALWAALYHRVCNSAARRQIDRAGLSTIDPLLAQFVWLYFIS